MTQKQQLQQACAQRQAEIDQREELVSEGRPDALMRDLVKNQSDPGTQERLDAIDRAMDIACQKGPAHLIELSFERMLRTCLRLQFRLESRVEPKIRTYGPGSGDEIQRLQAEALPSIERLQRHILQISKVYASIRHVLNLSQRSDDESLKERVLKLVEEVGEPAQEAGGEARKANVG